MFPLQVTYDFFVTFDYFFHFFINYNSPANLQVLFAPAAILFTSAHKVSLLVHKKRKANADSDHQHGGRSIAGSQLRLRKQAKLFYKTQIFRSPARTSPTELLLPVQVPLFLFSSQKSFLSFLSLSTDAIKKEKK